jgi:hypothetical protein
VGQFSILVWGNGPSLQCCSRIVNINPHSGKAYRYYSAGLSCPNEGQF